MHRGLRLSLIVPTHNEADGIKRLLQSLPSIIDEVIVVDWASTDGTPEVAERLGAQVAIEPERGYGRAYRRGIKQATGDVIITMDADGTYPVDHCQRLVDALLDRNLDFINCKRFPLSDDRSMGFVTHFGNRMLLQIGNSLFGLYLDDLLSGMWVFKQSIWADIEPTSELWSFSQEIKIRAACDLDIRFAEEWIPYDIRLGISKLSPLSVGLENLQQLFWLRSQLPKH